MNMHGVKRTFDLVLTLATCWLWLPLLLLCGLLVRLTMGRPVFFRQMRTGRHGKAFQILKFRTMTQHRDTNGALLPDAERITHLGRLLRTTSIDELPELVNVLKGDMSLVGPRPLPVEYLYRYTPQQARRHEVRPGITGWAQINGRNTISWERKFTLDVYYIDNWSLSLDLNILVLTVWKTLRREGISPTGQPTVEDFRGTKE